MTATPARTDETRTLDSLANGERAVIAGLECDPAITRRLMELGLTPGTEVQAVRRAPLGDPIEITVRGVHLWLRRSEASRIDVSPA